MRGNKVGRLSLENIYMCSSCHSSNIFEQYSFCPNCGEPTFPKSDHVLKPFPVESVPGKISSTVERKIVEYKMLCYDNVKQLSTSVNNLIRNEGFSIYGYPTIIHSRDFSYSYQAVVKYES